MNLVYEMKVRFFKIFTIDVYKYVHLYFKHTNIFMEQELK